MLAYFYWNPNPCCFTVPFIDFTILWYGVFFACGFWMGFSVFLRILSRYLQWTALGCSPDGAVQKCVMPVQSSARQIADQLTIYLVIAIVIGARVGHFLFYESPSYYLSNPLAILQIRDGGLASHGAVIALIIAVLFFSRRVCKTVPGLGWLRLLDLLAPPAALAAFWIRIGNFFNQEILGSCSQLPWAVIFGNPADGSAPEPRHPVQLYEALSYMAIFFLLLHCAKKTNCLLKEGYLAGLALISIFSMRFFIEFVKIEQSSLLSPSFFTMGQWLSIPFIFLGFIFYRKRDEP